MSFHNEILVLLAVFGTFRLAHTQEFRLPETQIPSNYDIHLTFPDEIFNGANTVFSGVVDITFELTVASTVIKLHSPGEVKTAKLVLQSEPDKSITVLPTTYNTTTEILSLTFENELVSNTSYKLTIEYEANIDVIDRRGIYRSSYVDSLGVRYLINTQFQSTFARKAFPCFDEPRFKATFTLKLTFPLVGYNAYSNTGPQSEEESDSG